MMAGALHETVHFVEYDPEYHTTYCRVAMITEVYEKSVDLLILTNQNMFITRKCPYDPEKERKGSWHYVER